MWFSGDRPYRTEAWVRARTQLLGRGLRRSEAGNGLAAPRAGRGGAGREAAAGSPFGQQRACGGAARGPLPAGGGS